MVYTLASIGWLFAFGVFIVFTHTIDSFVCLDNLFFSGKAISPLIHTMADVHV